MIKNVLFFVIVFCICVVFFNHKGWLKITPEGKKKAISFVLGSKRVAAKFAEVLEEEVLLNQEEEDLKE